MELTIDFAAHASPADRRLVIAFLNAVSRSTVTLGDGTCYRFGFSSEARFLKAQESLGQWERDGLLRWRESR